MISVLVVDDCPVISRLLSHTIDQQPDMKVVGVAHNGKDGAVMALNVNPDVVTMDIHMPGMDGFDAISAILAAKPIPIIVISGMLDNSDMAINFRAFELGAVAVERKPDRFSPGGSEASWNQLMRTIRAMHGVRPLIRRPSIQRKQTQAPTPVAAEGSTGIVAIGGSTGAPQILREILGSLPAAYPRPITIVQHMTAGFLPGLVTWLQENCTLRVKQAEDGERLTPGAVYMAPDDRHLTVSWHKADAFVKLTDASPVELFRPSVNVMFDSLAEGPAADTVGILLTGMGKDGAAGLRRMREAGCGTVVQDEHSAVVYGMPGEAMRLAAADQVLTPRRIVEFLSRRSPVQPLSTRAP